MKRNVISTLLGCVVGWLPLLAAQSQEVPQTTSNETAPGSPAAAPVVISIDEGGNLILQSSDPAALDRLEEIMQSNRPPRRPYDIFKVKHARASWIKLNLDDYFEDKDQDNSRNNRGFGYFYYGYNNEPEKDKTRQLGDKPPLRFIADNDTNSIVVQGADEVDRQTIKELITLWDVPEPTNDDQARFTRLVRVQFSRAESIANTIKDAYRDLLSANDKTFQEAADESKREGGGGKVESGGGMSYAFKGKLSLGVDAATNSILISAEGKPLLELICKMVEELDVSARREGNMTVYHLDPSVSSQSVKDALAALLTTPRQQQQKEQDKNQPQADPDAQPGANQRNNGRSNGDRAPSSRGGRSNQR